MFDLPTQGRLRRSRTGREKSQLAAKSDWKISNNNYVTDEKNYTYNDQFASAIGVMFLFFFFISMEFEKFTVETLFK